MDHQARSKPFQSHKVCFMSLYQTTYEASSTKRKSVASLRAMIMEEKVGHVVTQ